MKKRLQSPQQWNELLMSESLSNQQPLDVENIKSQSWKMYKNKKGGGGGE